MLSPGAQAVPGSPRRWSLFGIGAKRAEAAALAERIAVLQSELSQCKTQAGHRESLNHWVKAGVALLIFVLGYTAGTYHRAVRQTVGNLVPVLGLANAVGNIDAAEQAYEKGRYPLALRLLQPLAEQGDARAQAMLGLMYYHGRGVKQDDMEAAKWFHLAADQDEPRAQFNLGVMHAEGQGVPQDYVEAIKWYRLAAEQGEARAQFNLGVSYAEGQGADQNYILAYMWFNLAAPRFLPSETDRRRVAIHNRDLTASRMSREQIAEAQRLSREWKPKGAAASAG
jgi:TPR repeat protein